MMMMRAGMAIFFLCFPDFAATLTAPWMRDKEELAITVLNGRSVPLKHKNFPAGVNEGAAEVEAVHRLVHQPIKHHLSVPGTDGHPELEVAPLAQVVVADGEQAHHLHVKGHSGANGDSGQLVGHLFTVDKNSTIGGNADGLVPLKGLLPHLTVDAHAQTVPPIHLTRCRDLEGQRLAAEVGGGVGVEDGAGGLGGVIAQGDVFPAAQDVTFGS